jgi:predicted amidohydrolase YtcJ
VGQLADLVVLDQDVFAIPPERLRDVKVVTTVVGGRVVHGSVTLHGSFARPSDRPSE